MAFFAARQPILDTDKELFGYELLYRNSMENVFPMVDEEKATSNMIENLHLNLGLDRIAADKQAFINFTKASILSGQAKLLPPDQIVVEVLESVKPTADIYQAVHALFDLGYTIALDDFIHHRDWEKFYPLCKIIKVDCMDISQEQLLDVVDVTKRHPHIRLLAEKVETAEEFAHYKGLGFTLFQGYFFSKPEVVKSVALSTSQSLLSSLLNEVSKENTDISQIVKLIELDAALSFKLLRYTQSPLFKRRNKIESIKQAVVVLGKAELERFVMLLFAATFSEQKPTELMKLSLQRAKFCEAFAKATVHSDKLSSAFLVGMLSLLDAMLDSNLAAVISQLPLSTELKLALVRQQGWLADCIELSKAFEKADWDEIAKRCDEYAVDLDTMVLAYDEAIVWSEQRSAVFKS
ncbi:HDOD domain-containing protein [Glaciecola sp. XM2]|jgi:EAL and modified HD-GYP domain-containing signal transduction protein|uniref:EAL and HDOD domain-containing protein n=1 Tax=Glaciecola sp. XM2 TaxID=1914931 RepID=UPI001BDE2668|nr:HDOD domain-containing protein [Glaciecola sp. XM2]MBT1449905.1 HDOD domain-containing protein [Glaciecola sp. XM2]